MNAFERKLFRHCLAIATTVHTATGQERKGGLGAYIQHPIAVAQLLKDTKQNIHVICAGLLHDVIEDSQMTLESLKLVLIQLEGTGNEDYEKAIDRICSLVDILTDCFTGKLSDLPRAERAIIENLRIVSCNDYDAINVKFADIYDNAHFPKALDATFLPRWLIEKHFFLLMAPIVPKTRALYDLVHRRLIELDKEFHFTEGRLYKDYLYAFKKHTLEEKLNEII